MHDIFITLDHGLLLKGMLVIVILAGVINGALFGSLGPLLAVAAMASIAVVIMVLRRIEWGIMVMAALICLLPYAAMPVDIGFTPTFIDAAMAGIFGVWFFRVVSKAQSGFQLSSIGALVIAFMLTAVATFTAGLGHAPLTANVLRHFAEVILAISLFFVIINTIRREDQLTTITRVLLVCGALSAALGIIFYILPGELTVRILSSLRVFNYPTGDSILRYIEDNPELPMRAIGTSIDPNALGGLLVLVTIPAIVQLFSGRPVLPRKWLALMSGMMLLALLLTNSRGSLLAVALPCLALGILRHRKLLIIILLCAVLFIILPQTQPYIERMVSGVQGEDLSTQMRFGEYKDALILISRYPVLGVGFSGAPDIDLYIGVSSLYLLVASQMGLVGLSLYLILCAVFVITVFRSWRAAERGSTLEGLLLCYLFAFVGALISGVFDHFFFNINFIHLVALFWLTMGLGMTSSRLALESVAIEPRLSRHAVYSTG
jgi:polysaccharide biosynthesis protein PslJ